MFYSASFFLTVLRFISLGKHVIITKAAVIPGFFYDVIDTWSDALQYQYGDCQFSFHHLLVVSE
jgi:hypothetical protein